MSTSVAPRSGGAHGQVLSKTDAECGTVQIRAGAGTSGGTDVNELAGKCLRVNGMA